MDLRELYHELTDWTLQAADSEWAVVLLALVAFSDSIFFPIPPDPLLIAVGVASPGSAIWVALLATATSVAGAFTGYWLGKRVGRPVLDRLVAESTRSNEQKSCSTGMASGRSSWQLLPPFHTRYSRYLRASWHSPFVRF